MEGAGLNNFCELFFCEHFCEQSLGMGEREELQEFYEVGSVSSLDCLGSGRIPGQDIVQELRPCGA